MKKHHLFVMVMVAVVAIGFFALMPRKVAENGITVSKPITGESGIGGPFALTNQNGEAVTDQTYAGKLKLVFFGFTFCPSICPTDLMVMSKVMASLTEEEKTQIVPIFVTVDPERDNVEQMKSYLSNFSPAIQGLTGTQEQVDAAIKAYRVYAKKVQEPNMTEYTMDHSAYMYLMSRKGDYIMHFQHDEKPEVISAAIRTHLKD